MSNNWSFNPIYLLFLLIISILLLKYFDTFQIRRCVGRDLGTCLADINCEWDPYYNACANRTYNAVPRITRWGWPWWSRPWY